jgi:hypothetical protein
MIGEMVAKAACRQFKKGGVYAVSPLFINVILPAKASFYQNKQVRGFGDRVIRGVSAIWGGALRPVINV